jgi:tyrosinase
MVYPFDEKIEAELVVNGPAIETSIGAHGEEDSFKMVIEARGRYILETGGKTDVNLGLYGPDDRTNQIAFDDDSGKSLNAKIRIDLQPGTYYARVCHFRPRGLGDYSLTLKRG